MIVFEISFEHDIMDHVISVVIRITNQHVLFTIEVQCLKGHVPTVDKSFADLMDMLKIPQSQLDPNSVGDFIDNQKLVLKEVDHDVKDAKRRISAAKGPRRRVAPNEEADVHSDSDD